MRSKLFVSKTKTDKCMSGCECTSVRSAATELTNRAHKQSAHAAYSITYAQILHSYVIRYVCLCQSINGYGTKADRPKIVHKNLNIVMYIYVYIYIGTGAHTYVHVVDNMFARTYVRIYTRTKM